MATGVWPATIGRVGHQLGLGTNLLAELAQLLLGRRALHVERGKQHLLALAQAQAERDLGRGGGLAGALEAHHQHRDRRLATELEICRGAAQHLDQVVVHQLDDHLARGDAPEHLQADRLVAHLGDELLDHRQGDVGLEQRQPHLLQGLVDIALGQRAAPAQAVEHLAEPAGQALEHAGLKWTN